MWFHVRSFPPRNAEREPPQLKLWPWACLPKLSSPPLWTGDPAGSVLLLPSGDQTLSPLQKVEPQTKIYSFFVEVFSTYPTQNILVLITVSAGLPFPFISLQPSYVFFQTIPFQFLSSLYVPSVTSDFFYFIFFFVLRLAVLRRHLGWLPASQTRKLSAGESTESSSLPFVLRFFFFFLSEGVGNLSSAPPNVNKTL